MFTIYIDNKILARICKENAGLKDIDQQDPWYRIIVTLKRVYVNIADKLLSPEKYEELLSTIEQAGEADADTIEKKRELLVLQRLSTLNQSEQVEVLPCKKVDIDKLQSPFYRKMEKNNLLNEACAVYILNISADEAEKIQSEYGVICQSSQNMDASILINKGVKLTPKINESNYGWARVLKLFKKFPSNAIIVNDRNLFSNDEIINGSNGSRIEKISGLKNLTEILDTIIPKRFNGGDYHVLICTDIHEKIDDKTHLTFTKLTSKLEGIRTQLEKSRKNRFDINIELFAYHSTKNSKEPNGYGHNKTHNRRLLSNYYVYTFEHKINAFENSISLCSQDINGFRLFSSGIDDDGNDPPEKLHRDMIEDLSEIMNHFAELHNNGELDYLDQEIYKYSINGKEQPFPQITNRILQ